jgi:hypothetical protein
MSDVDKLTWHSIREEDALKIKEVICRSHVHVQICMKLAVKDVYQFVKSP